jgi:hypothetical protein
VIAVGFTVKSGWAAAVVVERIKDSIRIVESRRVDLCDPALPESKQPYHDGFATMRKGGPRLTKLLEAVHRAGRASVISFLDDVSVRFGDLRGVGVVVGSLIDPATIGNEHIRIHAMEGRLFREVVTAAAEKRGFACAVLRERDLPAAATRALKRSEASLSRAVAECDRDRNGPWRTEQKSAALAAWLVCVSGAKGGRA